MEDWEKDFFKNNSRTFTFWEMFCTILIIKFPKIMSIIATLPPLFDIATWAGKQRDQLKRVEPGSHTSSYNDHLSSSYLYPGDNSLDFFFFFFF